MRSALFCNDTATTEIYTRSLHDAPSDLPHERFPSKHFRRARPRNMNRTLRTLILVCFATLFGACAAATRPTSPDRPDRKSTRLNSSHANISYAAFCLKTQTSTCALTTLL